jgi:hypothetical protein
MATAKEQRIDPALLRVMFSYDAETGTLTWLVRLSSHYARRGHERPMSRAHVGRVAGSLLPNGYMNISVKGERLMVHRVVWAWCYGAWPAGQVDHINHVRSDNRIVNLRDVSASENQRNASKRSGNLSGVVGVSFDNQKKDMGSAGYGRK